ncbi:MAG: o-succinylbenzoate synthase [Actinomycetota bacterium]
MGWANALIGQFLYNRDESNHHVQVMGFRIPLRVPFRGVAQREGVLIKGPEGWGEYSPFPGYSDGREDLCLEAALESACRPWPAPLRDAIPVHVTVPALAPDEAFKLVIGSGCSSAKVKVAEGDDEGRVEAVRHALGPHGKISIDANAAWNLDEAALKIKILSRHGLEFVEQPVATIEEMAKLRRLVDVALAADEIASTPDQAARVAEHEAADVLVVKVQNYGGVREAVRAIGVSGLPAVVSSLIETSVGISAGVALAAALPELRFPCGLGTLGILAGDVSSDPLLPEAGYVSVRRPGVDHQVIAEFEQDPGLVPGWDKALAVSAGLTR